MRHLLRIARNLPRALWNIFKAFWHLIRAFFGLPLNTWKFIKAIFFLLKETAEGWNKDNGSILAAALAFYTVFSITPVLVIGISIAGLVFGKSAAEAEIVREIEQFAGADAANAIHDLIERSVHPSSNVIAIIISFGTMLLGASWVFTEMRDALNTIWGVPKPDRAVHEIIWNRIVGFFMAVGVGFLLLVSLIINTGLVTLHTIFTSVLPAMPYLWQVVYYGFTLILIMFFFAMLFKILPDARVKWSDVWVGAAVTTLLFEIGRYLIVLYLQTRSFSTTYGAAGSLVVILLWVYYSAQIFLFGAEFTHIYAQKYGSKIIPWKSEQNNAKGKKQDVESARQEEANPKQDTQEKPKDKKTRKKTRRAKGRKGQPAQPSPAPSAPALTEVSPRPDQAMFPQESEGGEPPDTPPTEGGGHANSGQG